MTTTFLVEQGIDSIALKSGDLGAESVPRRLPRRLPGRDEDPGPRARAGDHRQPGEPAQHHRNLEAGCWPVQRTGTTSSPPRWTAARRGRGARFPASRFARAGPSDTASDPWVSAGGDGTVYFGGQSGVLSPTARRDRGEPLAGRRAHWPAPATVSPRLEGNETPSITGSPTLDGHAYMVWANFTGAPADEHPLFSRTTDNAATWSPPVLVDQPGPFASIRLPGCSSCPTEPC